MDMWPSAKPEIEVEKIVAKVRSWLRHADGVTISGGEPFEQMDGVLELADQLKKAGADTIFVFTGFEWDDIKGDLEQRPGVIDAIMTGPFQIDREPTKNLRGSDNQKLICLTPRGRTMFSQYDTQAPNYALDVMMLENGGVLFAGIPRAGDFRRLEKLMADAGHIFKSTEGRRSQAS